MTDKMREDKYKSLDLDPDIDWIEWNFEPYTEVYAGRVDEPVFVGNWQKTMLKSKTGEVIGNTIYVDPYFVDNYAHEFPVLDVLTYRQPDAHDTRLASTFIHSLSRGNLRALPREADYYMTQNHLTSKEAFLLAWTMRNTMFEGYRRTRTPRDFICAEFNGAVQNYTAQDAETLEQVVIWLSTKKGQKFLGKCETDIDRIVTRQGQYMAPVVER